MTQPSLSLGIWFQFGSSSPSLSRSHFFACVQCAECPTKTIPQIPIANCFLALPPSTINVDPLPLLELFGVSSVITRQSFAFVDCGLWIVDCELRTLPNPKSCLPQQLLAFFMADAIKLSCSTHTISPSPFIPASPKTYCQWAQVGLLRPVVSLSGVSSAACGFVSPTASTTPKKLDLFKIHATVTQTEQPKWWERNAGPNMIDIHSTQEFLTALSEAGDRLVIVEFYGTWCASCRAIFPKICRTAAEHPEILFLKVNFDENKLMCKKLNVRVLPYFQFYRGADGLLEAFSCSLAKFQRIKDAIELHSSARCSLGPPKGVPDLNLESPPTPKENLEESSGT